jgi:hypothetical protein
VLLLIAIVYPRLLPGAEMHCGVSEQAVLQHKMGLSRTIFICTKALQWSCAERGHCEHWASSAAPPAAGYGTDISLLQQCAGQTVFQHKMCS